MGARTWRRQMAVQKRWRRQMTVKQIGYVPVSMTREEPVQTDQTIQSSRPLVGLSKLLFKFDKLGVKGSTPF
jgi:hypothetical protein